MVYRALFVVGACVHTWAHTSWNASHLSKTTKSFSSSIAIPASDELEDLHDILVEEYGFSLKLQRDMSAVTANFKVFETKMERQEASVLWDAPPACLYRGFAVNEAGTALGAVVCTLCNGRLHAGIHFFDSINHFGELKSVQNGIEMIDIGDMRALDFDDIALERSDFSLESTSSRRLMADTRRILLADECDLRPNKTVKILNILDFSRLALFDTVDEAVEESLFIFMWVRDLYFYEPPSSVEAVGIPADQIGLFKPAILNCRIVPLYDGILTLPQQFSWENPILSSQTQLLQFTIFILANPFIISLNGEAVDNVQVRFVFFLFWMSWPTSQLYSGINSFETPNVRGIAWIGAACDLFSLSMTFTSNPPSFGADPVIFYGTVAAHEFGHNLGMRHDIPNRWNIMSAVTSGLFLRENFLWSDLSRLWVNYHFNRYDLGCYDDPEGVPGRGMDPSIFAPEEDPEPAPDACVIVQNVMDLAGNSKVTGNVDSFGTIDCGRNSTITGNLRAERKVLLRAACVVEGNIEANDQISLRRGAAIGDLENTVNGEVAVLQPLYPTSFYAPYDSTLTCTLTSGIVFDTVKIVVKEGETVMVPCVENVIHDVTVRPTGVAIFQETCAQGTLFVKKGGMVKFTKVIQDTAFDQSEESGLVEDAYLFHRIILRRGAKFEHTFTMIVSCLGVVWQGDQVPLNSDAVLRIQQVSAQQRSIIDSKFEGQFVAAGSTLVFGGQKPFGMLTHAGFFYAGSVVLRPGNELKCGSFAP